jgi:hypothetical protein
VNAADYPAFVPARLLGHPWVMTLAGAQPRRAAPGFEASARERVFATTDGNRVLGLSHFQRDRARACLVLLHGLGGDVRSPYMVGTAEKAFARGLSVLRLNARNCGGTEHLARASYHGGTTEDLLCVAEELAAEGFERIYPVGFSLGGNMAIKLAAELGERAPTWLAGVATLSPCLDFARAAQLMNAHVFGRACQRRFLRELRRIVERRMHLDGIAFDPRSVSRLRTLREFDERFTAPLGGFSGVEDYYARASAIAYAARVRVPTLIVAARDDPLVPFDTFERPEIARNPCFTLLSSSHGGHTAFLGREPASWKGGSDPDRRWGENRLVQYCLARERAASC